MPARDRVTGGGAHSCARTAFRYVFALALFAFGVWLIYLEMVLRTGSNPRNVYIGAGAVALGCLVVIPAEIAAGLKQVIVVVVPAIADIRYGGRRRTDPPPPTGPPAVPPDS